MKKIIAILLVLGFTLPATQAASDIGENSENEVKCEEIFQGAAVKPVGNEVEDDKPRGNGPSQKK